eukprot:UN09997
MLRNHVDRVNLGLIPTCLDGLTNALLSLNTTPSSASSTRTYSMMHVHWNVDVQKVTNNNDNNNTLEKPLTNKELTQLAYNTVNKTVVGLLDERIQVLNDTLCDLSISQLYQRYYIDKQQNTDNYNKLLSIGYDIAPLLDEYHEFIINK